MIKMYMVNKNVNKQLSALLTVYWNKRRMMLSIITLMVITHIMPFSNCALENQMGLVAKSDEMSVQLSWLHTEGALCYEVCRDGHPLTVTEANYYDDTHVRDHYIHSYHVSAICADGITLTSDSADASVKRLSAPRLSARFGPSGVELTWYSVKGADGYRVYANDAEIERVGGLKYIDSHGNSIGKTYYVIAYNDVGDSFISNEIEASESKYSEVGCCDDTTIDYYIYEINEDTAPHPSRSASYMGIVLIVIVMLGFLTFAGVQKNKSETSSDREEAMINEENEDSERFCRSQIYQSDKSVNEMLKDRKISRDGPHDQSE